jgi:hypothetical protein
MRIKTGQGKKQENSLNTLVAGSSFLWVLSLSVQRKYLVPSGNENMNKKNKK